MYHENCDDNKKKAYLVRGADVDWEVQNHLSWAEMRDDLVGREESKDQIEESALIKLLWPKTVTFKKLKRGQYVQNTENENKWAVRWM